MWSHNIGKIFHTNLQTVRSLKKIPDIEIYPSTADIFLKLRFSLLKTISFYCFLSQKLHGKPYTIVGDGTQTRDFTFVTDVVDACITAAKSDLDSEILNVGSGNTYSVNRLVELLGGDYVYIPKRPGEPECTFANITKIQKLLKWKPKISFEEGVKIMLENIDYWRNAPVWTPKNINEATKDWFRYLSK